MPDPSVVSDDTSRQLPGVRTNVPGQRRMPAAIARQVPYRDLFASYQSAQPYTVDFARARHLLLTNHGGHPLLVELDYIEGKYPLIVEPRQTVTFRWPATIKSATITDLTLAASGPPPLIGANYGDAGAYVGEYGDTGAFLLIVGSDTPIDMEFTSAPAAAIVGVNGNQANVLGSALSVLTAAQGGPTKMANLIGLKRGQAPVIVWEADLSVLTLSSTYDFTKSLLFSIDDAQDCEVWAVFRTAPSGGTPASFSVILQAHHQAKGALNTATDWLGVLPECIYNGTAVVPLASSNATSGTVTVTFAPAASPALVGGVVVQTPGTPGTSGAVLRVPYRALSGLCRVGVACTTPWTAGILDIVVAGKV